MTVNFPAMLLAAVFGITLPKSRILAPLVRITELFHGGNWREDAFERLRHLSQRQFFGRRRSDFAPCSRVHRIASNTPLIRRKTAFEGQLRPLAAVRRAVARAVGCPKPRFPLI
jgi:hypothetical protein